MAFVAYVSIEVLLHPEPATTAQNTICLLGRKRFLRMQERRERDHRRWRDKRANVVGHDAPGMKLIPLPVEPKPRGFDDAGNFRAAQKTGSSACIERRLNPAHAFGATLLAICDLLKLFRHPVQDLSWQAVIQAKHNMLRHTSYFRVWKVSSRSETGFRPLESFKHRMAATRGIQSPSPPFAG